MLFHLLVIAAGVALLFLARKRKKEYRSYGTFVTLGVFLILLPLLIFLTLFFAMAFGGPIPT